MTPARFTAPAPVASKYEPGTPLPAPALVDLAEAVTVRVADSPAPIAGGDAR